MCRRDITTDIPHRHQVKTQAAHHMQFYKTILYSLIYTTYTNTYVYVVNSFGKKMHLIIQLK